MENELTSEEAADLDSYESGALQSIPRTQSVFYVNMYLVERNYGGPEEGGWWYETGVILKSIKSYNLPDAEAIAEGMGEDTAENSHGIRICIEDVPGENFADDSFYS